MRVSGSFEATFHELDHPDLMVFWGSSKRRKRMIPRALLVGYHQAIDTGEWKLTYVYLMGAYNSSSIGVRLYERQAWSPITPDWVHPLVERCAPIRAVPIEFAVSP